MKKTVNIKQELLIFFIIFLISMIIFIPFLKPHFSTDSYYIANKGYENYVINNSLKDGRIFMAALGYIAELIHIPINAYIIILTIFALITNCITVIILKNSILQYKNSKKAIIELFVTFISYFTIFNFMYIENMLFVECFVMSLSILFYMLAARVLINKNKFYIIKTLILVAFGVLGYQGTISMYLVSLLVFSLLKNGDYKQIIKDLFIGGLILIFGVLFQMLVIKFSEKTFGVQQVRANGLRSLPTNAIRTLMSLKNIITYTGFVYTKYLYIAFILILEIFIVIKAYKDKLSNTFLINQFLIVIFSILFGLSVSFISMSGFWSARIRYSIGTTIGFLLLYLYCKTDLIENIRKDNLLIIVTFCVYALSIVINYICIMINTLNVNYKDEQMAIEIINYVQNYEQKNNVVVDNLVVFPGCFESKGFYKELKYYNSVLSWSSIRTEWSIEGTLEMYSNREFNLVEPVQDKISYYIDNVDKDRDYMCIDNTLYVSYYIN